MSILKDRDGKLSLGRIMLILLFLFAFAFLGKAFFLWDRLPDGIVAAICTLFGTISVYVKATEAINVKHSINTSNGLSYSVGDTGAEVRKEM